MEPPFTFLTARALIIYALWILLGALILRFKPLWESQKQVLWVGFLWLSAFVPFFIWWEPWNIEFWVSSTVPCWILMGVVVSDLSNGFSHPILRLANRCLVIAMWAGLVTLLFFYTGVVQTLASPMAAVPETKEPVHAHQDLLDILDIKVRAQDLLILNGINTIPFYIDRYKKIKYLNLHAFLKKYKQAAKDEEELNKTKSPQIPPTVPASMPLDPWGDLTNLFKDRWKHHHRVWVLAEAVDEKDEWRMKLEKLMGLPLGQLTDFFKGFELKPVLFHKKIYFYQVLEPENIPTEPIVTPAIGDKGANQL
jgi:hypothetical protein